VEQSKVPVCRVEGFVFGHVFACCINEDGKPGFHGGIASLGNAFQRFHPVGGVIEIERVPAELIGNLVKFLGSMHFTGNWFKVSMCCCW
jgi:hypothetical protein